MYTLEEILCEFGITINDLSDETKKYIKDKDKARHLANGKLLKNPDSLQAKRLISDYETLIINKIGEDIENKEPKSDVVEKEVVVSEPKSDVVEKEVVVSEPKSDEVKNETIEVVKKKKRGFFWR